MSNIPPSTIDQPRAVAEIGPYIRTGAALFAGVTALTLAGCSTPGKVPNVAPTSSPASVSFQNDPTWSPEVRAQHLNNVDFATGNPCLPAPNKGNIYEQPITDIPGFNGTLEFRLGDLKLCGDALAYGRLDTTIPKTAPSNTREATVTTSYRRANGDTGDTKDVMPKDKQTGRTIVQTQVWDPGVYTAVGDTLTICVNVLADQTNPTQRECLPPITRQLDGYRVDAPAGSVLVHNR